MKLHYLLSTRARMDFPAQSTSDTISGLLKRSVHPNVYQNRGSSSRSAEKKKFCLAICVNISMIDLKTHRKNRRHLKNTKNKVPRSDIGYISMISTDFDRIFGDFGRFRRIFVNLNENPYFFNKGNIEIAENPIKIDRDHRDISDIGY